MSHEDAREHARVRAADQDNAAVTSFRAKLTAGATRWQLQTRPECLRPCAAQRSWAARTCPRRKVALPCTRHAHLEVDGVVLDPIIHPNLTARDVWSRRCARVPADRRALPLRH
eukprot:scaffold94584_cov57-Phaeocystis_antarctica.AAC.1